MEEESAKEIIRYALDNGVNFLDTSPWYGNSESILGSVLKEYPREKYRLSTKVGRYFDENVEKMFDFSAARIRKSLESSLEKLNVDRVDIVFIHDAEFCADLRQISDRAIPELLKAKKEGKTRFVGLSGYDLGILRRIVELAPENSIDFILSFARLTLFNRDLEFYAGYFRSKKVGVINASPTGMGLFAPEGPPGWHAAPEMLKSGCGKAAEFCGSRGVSLASLAVKAALHEKSAPLCLVSAKNMDEVKANLQSASNELTVKEKELIEEVKENFFKGLPLTHWEVGYVDNYWNKMAEKRCFQNTDL